MKKEIHDLNHTNNELNQQIHNLSNLKDSIVCNLHNENLVLKQELQSILYKNSYCKIEMSD